MKAENLIPLSDFRIQLCNLFASPLDLFEQPATRVFQQPVTGFIAARGVTIKRRNGAMIDFRQRVKADMYTAWTYPKNVSKKAHYLDISFFLPTEQVQELWIEKNAFPASFD